MPTKKNHPKLLDSVRHYVIYSRRVRRGKGAWGEHGCVHLSDVEHLAAVLRTTPGAIEHCLHKLNLEGLVEHKLAGDGVGDFTGTGLAVWHRTARAEHLASTT